MTKQDLLNKVHERAFLNLILDLIEISDSFDQLKKLAILTDLLYSPFEPEYKELAKGLEYTAQHLRDNPNIGLKEVKKEVKKDFHFDTTYSGCLKCDGVFSEQGLD